jgi:hypothetical protein
MGLAYKKSRGFLTYVKRNCDNRRRNTTKQSYNKPQPPTKEGEKQWNLA